MFFDKEKTDKIYKRTYIQVFGYIILFFSALILNEIIILNFCGLNKNTFTNIALRGKLDFYSFKGLNDNEYEDDNISEEEINDELNTNNTINIISIIEIIFRVYKLLFLFFVYR